MTDALGSADLASLVAHIARADLAGDLSGELEPEALIDRVLRRAVGLLPGATEVGLTVLAHSARGTPTHLGSGTLVDACALVEDQLGEGPAHHTVELGGTVRVDDLPADRRWPRYAEQVSRLGIASMLLTPLPGAEGPQGLLTACSAVSYAFGPAVEQIVPNVANRVAVALAYADKLRHMRRAIDTRTTIGQACGILIERHKIRPERAFEMLVQASQRNHLKLRELAARLVETGQEPERITR